MCGIVGWLHPGRPSPAHVEAALRSIRHRGPDADGRWSDGNCTLGFRRLAIIDLTDAGCQPMGDERGEIQVVFNGEIYNFPALRAELEALGHRFRSHSDTEVLVHGWRRWGRAMLPRLRGMFAFGLWDARTRELVLARDRVGKKPLFYAWQGGRLTFASELQAILADPRIPREPDEVAIDEYLTWGYVPAPRTGFVGIEKLPPAHVLTIRVDDSGTSTQTLERYWALDHGTSETMSDGEAIELVRAQLREAVEVRLMSDVPLGAFLSGGIDSSIVVGLMAAVSSERVRTFSIGFDVRAYDELRYARRIAERWDTDHTEEVVQPDALALLPMLVRHYGEPYADSSAIPTYYVASIARRQVTVALNGDGGDESFGGYERYRAMLAADRLRQIPGASLASRAVARVLPDSGDPKDRIRRVRRFLAAAARPPSDRYSRWVGYFDVDEKASLYTHEQAALVGGGAAPLTWMRGLFESGIDDPAEAAMAADVLSYLPYDLLVKVDIASMATSLEARSPFLDHHVMELAARLPRTMKIRGGTGKWILKQAFPELLPGDIATRPKMGFGVPVGHWFRGPLRDVLRDATMSDRAVARGRFRPEVVGALVTDHLEGRADHTAKLWNLLMLEHWQRELVDGPLADGA
jgi:asparagine synthase (glutamine-hydrolysing)